MKPTQSSSRLSLVTALLFVLTIAGCRRDESGKDLVTFGAVVPLTGDVASWGEDTSNGAALAVDLANQTSTEYRYKVVFEDSKGNGAQAVAGVRKLINLDKVVALIGDNISGPTIAMVPVVDSAKVPLISPSASSPKLSGMSTYFFRVYPSDSAEGAFMAQVAHDKLDLRSVAILYINNEFGVGLGDVFGSTFAKKGGTIPLELGYNEDETDFRPYLTRIKSANPDGVYLGGYYQDGGSILKQARELGLDSQFLGSTTHEDPRLLTIAGNAAEGFVYPFSTGYDEGSQAEAVVEFQHAFETKFSKKPGLVTALGYDCANLLIDAVEKVGPNSERVRDYLAGVHGYQGATGEMSFDANGDIHKPVRLKTLKNGRFVFVE